MEQTKSPINNLTLDVKQTHQCSDASGGKGKISTSTVKNTQNISKAASETSEDALRSMRMKTFTRHKKICG